jgi:hypothetical protein
MADQPDAPPDQTIHFGRFDGYTNTIARERLGPRDLALALDIDLDDAGQARRRRGRTQVATGSFHSLWNADDGTVYGVKDGQLGIIRPDYSFVDTGRTVGSDPVCFIQVGDPIYFSAAHSTGIITEEVKVGPWGPDQPIWYSPVAAPSATLAPVGGKRLGKPPPARFMAYYNGRIYGASGTMLWATEFFMYNYVDLTRTFFQFEGEITMVAAVTGGLYIGTTVGVFWMAGTSLVDMKRQSVMDSPVIPGSAIMIPAELANPRQIGTQVDSPVEVSVAFMTTTGFCVGAGGGKCTNLTEARVFFPSAQRAVPLWRRQDGVNQYIVCTDSDGDPKNGARFGDFVDAEIIRGKASWIDVTDTANITDQGN